MAATYSGRMRALKVNPFLVVTVLCLALAQHAGLAHDLSHVDKQSATIGQLKNTADGCIKCASFAKISGIAAHSTHEDAPLRFATESTRAIEVAEATRRHIHGSIRAPPGRC